MRYLKFLKTQILQKDVEDRAFTVALTYHQLAEILDTKIIDTTSTGYTVPPGIYETSCLNLMLKTPS